VSWDRLMNVNPWGVETAQNTRAYLGNWNINTNNWLRNYVYLRVTPRGKKPGFRASMATFVTSAFWHGFYPGYYLSFVLASFVQTVAKSSFTQCPNSCLLLTCPRSTPLYPAFFPGSQNFPAHPIQDLLRYSILPDDTANIFLRRSSLRNADPLSVTTCLVPRLLLCDNRHGSRDSFLRFASQSLPRQATEQEIWGKRR
jgi:hypothetical protein